MVRLPADRHGHDIGQSWARYDDIVELLRQHGVLDHARTPGHVLGIPCDVTSDGDPMHAMLNDRCGSTEVQAGCRTRRLSGVKRK